MDAGLCHAGVWAALCDRSGLFSAERRALDGWCVRSVALPLRTGGLLLYSPTRSLGEEAHGWLAALGTPQFLLAPNHFHHLGIGEHRERYPSSVICASERARPRVERMTGQRVHSLDGLRQVLPPHVTVLEPEGTRAGEVWLRVETRDGVAWVVSDAFFNMAQTPAGLSGLFCRATGTTPGLRVGSTFLWLALSDRRRYRRWLLDQLAADRPRMLVPGHGEVIAGVDLSDTLRILAEKRL